MRWIEFWLGLGLDPKDLTLVHVSLRGAVVFIAALIMVRIADRRFLSKMSAVDAILGFILASMLARAVNGSASFFPTLGGGFVLVLLHKACAALAFRSQRFGNLIKGCEDVIIENGVVHEEAMRTHHITKKDLLEELRQEGSIGGPEEVKKAFVERSGKVSVIPAHGE
jgi:uncharacterized membrane protein YcaP (DUF421 family)